MVYLREQQSISNMSIFDFWCYVTWVYFECTSPTCDHSVVLLASQPDPSELLHLTTLWVPLQHVLRRQRCSFRLSPGDGGIAFVWRYSDTLERLGCRSCLMQRRNYRPSSAGTSEKVFPVGVLSFTFCVMRCDCGRGGQPFGVASPHGYFTVRAERDFMTPGVTADVSDQVQASVWVGNSEFVP